MLQRPLVLILRRRKKKTLFPPTNKWTKCDARKRPIAKKEQKMNEWRQGGLENLGWDIYMLPFK